MEIFVLQSKEVSLPAEQSTDTFNQKNINLALQQFNFTCSIFTAVMAIKHQLQYSLFNNHSVDNTVNVTSDENITSLSLLLEYLETLAGILQDIEVRMC